MRHPELVRKLGVVSASSTSDGGVFGDLAGLPSARLAVLPGTTHVGLIGRVDWLDSMHSMVSVGRAAEGVAM
jgi:hypothetical protein